MMHGVLTLKPCSRSMDTGSSTVSTRQCRLRAERASPHHRIAASSGNRFHDDLSSVLPPQHRRLEFRRERRCYPGMFAYRFLADYQRCDRSALRASALLRLYRSAYGLRFAVPFMMIATYISGTTHLMRATRSRHCSPESSPIQEAQQCADIMTEMSSTFAVAARQADLLLSAIERYINHDAGSAAAVRQPVSIDTSKSIPENDVDFGDCNPMTEACSTSPTLPSSSMELTTSQQSLNRTLELLLAGPTIDLPITMAVGREDESVMEETAQVRSLGGEPNLWLWDFQSSRPDELSLSTRGDGMATGVDERNNPFDWDSDVLGLP